MGCAALRAAAADILRATELPALTHATTASTAPSACCRSVGAKPACRAAPRSLATWVMSNCLPPGRRPSTSAATSVTLAANWRQYSEMELEPGCVGVGGPAMGLRTNLGALVSGGSCMSEAHSVRARVSHSAIEALRSAMSVEAGRARVASGGCGSGPKGNVPGTTAGRARHLCMCRRASPRKKTRMG